MLPKVFLYSDGGANPNPGPGGFGIILRHLEKQKEYSEGYKLTTNNRMELRGVITGLKMLKVVSDVTVITDSRYTIDGFEKGWVAKWQKQNWMRTKSERVINADLWQELFGLVNKHKVSFQWVKGHTGHAENERCDTLATNAMKSNNLLEDTGYVLVTGTKSEDHTKRQEILATLSTHPSNAKVESEGDPCKKCGSPVDKKFPKRKSNSKLKAYYYEYFFQCPYCNTLYMPEKAKKYIKK